MSSPQLSINQPAQPAAAADVSDSQIAALLESRYGDGLVYLPSNGPKVLYAQAVQRGFIDSEGYLTRKGRVLLARFDSL